MKQGEIASVFGRVISVITFAVASSLPMCGAHLRVLFTRVTLPGEDFQRILNCASVITINNLTAGIAA
jgi:hypothetical protein